MKYAPDVPQVLINPAGLPYWCQRVRLSIQSSHKTKEGKGSHNGQFLYVETSAGKNENGS